jgi:hypothetical protein
MYAHRCRPAVLVEQSDRREAIAVYATISSRSAAAATSQCRQAVVISKRQSKLANESERVSWFFEGFGFYFSL